MSEVWIFSHFSTLKIALGQALLRLTVVGALTLAIAFFVAAELALVSASRSEMAQLSQHSEPKTAKTAQLVQQAQQNLPQYLSVTQTGTTAGSLLLGWIGEGATVHWIEPWFRWLPLGQFSTLMTTHAIAVAVAFFLVTYLEIVLGELVPKVLAANEPEVTALALIRPLQVCSYLFFPLMFLLNGSVRLLTGRLIRTKPVLELPTLAEEFSLDSTLPLTTAHPDTHLVLEQVNATTVCMAATADITAMNTALQLELPVSPAYRTIAGFMVHHLGRVPAPGECLVWGELELEVAESVSGCLKSVLLRQLTRPLNPLPSETVTL